MKWAYFELAKLGGWKDTKRNGQAPLNDYGKDGLNYKASLKVMTLPLESDL